MEHKIDAWGRVLFRSEDAIELLFRGHDITKLCIAPSSEIDEYNAICIEHDKPNHVVHPVSIPELSPEEDTLRRQRTWWMPCEYVELDVRKKLLNLCRNDIETQRVIMEMRLFEERGLLPVLRLMCFLVDHWRERGIVWGVGRGSSVASYCLFLIGVHRINSIAYDLPISEFLK
jgi:DNA polymerase III alpha subunit